MTDFYGVFSSIGFTILGLWFVVAQTRSADWMARPSTDDGRRQCHFTSPGPGS